MHNPQGKLYIVGTPIGNLQDLTERARLVLSNVDTVYAEDTRRALKLFQHIGAHPPVKRCDENVIRKVSPAILDELDKGLSLAYITDAGMPTISDPGSVLVDAALNRGIVPEVIPGPTALTTAIALSGLRADSWIFVGFLPRKSMQKKQRLKELAESGMTFIVYESARRIANTLQGIAEACPTRRVALCRELTKVHEEIIRESANNLADLITQREQEESLKGECVVVVEGIAKDKVSQHMQLDNSAKQLAKRLANQLVLSGISGSAAAKIIAHTCEITRDEAYQLVRMARNG